MRPILKENTVDFLGLNYYHPRRVKARETSLDTTAWVPDRYFEDYEMPDRRINPYRGWEIYPKAVYDIAMAVKQEYRNIPWYLSENGMGVEGEERFADAPDPSTMTTGLLSMRNILNGFIAP